MDLSTIKFFFMFFFVGAMLRKWVYERVSNLVFRFFIISTLIAGLVLLFIGEHVMMHALYFGMVIVAVSLGMSLDMILDWYTTKRAREKNGKKKHL